MDIDTGIRLYSETSVGSLILKKDERVQVEIKQINSIRLPPKSKQFPVISERTISKRLEDVKRLLDQKLITPDEAAAKRKEILNSL